MIDAYRDVRGGNVTKQMIQFNLFDRMSPCTLRVKRIQDLHVVFKPMEPLLILAVVTVHFVKKGVFGFAGAFLDALF